MSYQLFCFRYGPRRVRPRHSLLLAAAFTRRYWEFAVHCTALLALSLRVLSRCVAAHVIPVDCSARRNRPECVSDQLSTFTVRVSAQRCVQRNAGRRWAATYRVHSAYQQKTGRVDAHIKLVIPERKSHDQCCIEGPSLDANSVPPAVVSANCS